MAIQFQESDLFEYFKVNEGDWDRTPESIKNILRSNVQTVLNHTEFWELERSYPKIYRRFADAQGWKK